MVALEARERNLIMKNELRTVAMNAVIPAVEAAFPQAVKVVVSKKEMYAIDTGTIDDSGNPIYATLEVTVKDNEGTKTHDGFDIEEAKAAYAEKWHKAAEKAAKPKASKAANPEAAEKRKVRMTALRNWWMNEADSGVGYTSTMVKGILGNVYADYQVMQVGSDLKLLSEEMPTNCEMRMEDGKRHYYKA